MVMQIYTIQKNHSSVMMACYWCNQLEQWVVYLKHLFEQLF